MTQTDEFAKWFREHVGDEEALVLTLANNNPVRVLMGIAEGAWKAGRQSIFKKAGEGVREVAGLHPVLQEWAWELPLMQQTVLLCALRGPDGVQKDSPAKRVVRYFRRAVLHNARPLAESDFMEEANLGRWLDITTDFFADTDRYPAHFLLHLYHAAEILGYKHPDAETMGRWALFYKRACDAFHMRVELESELDARLNR